MLTACLISCQTAPHRFELNKKGRWKGQIQILSDKPAVPLTIVFRADGLSRLRMDITTISGFFIGSILVEGDQFKALMAREKKFYQGSINLRSMKDLLSVPIDPRWLARLLFEIPDPQWTCEYTPKGYLRLCRHSDSELAVTWLERVKDQRNLEIRLGARQISLFLSQFVPEIGDEESAFLLAAPEAFKKINLH